MNKEQELKPCPCCGSDDIYCGGLDYIAQGIQCRSCGLRISRYPKDFKGGVFLLEKLSLDRESGLKEALKFWNQRAIAVKQTDTEGLGER